jgi:hypothetical protein
MEHGVRAVNDLDPTLRAEVDEFAIERAQNFADAGHGLPMSRSGVT